MHWISNEETRKHLNKNPCIKLILYQLYLPVMFSKTRCFFFAFYHSVSLTNPDRLRFQDISCLQAFIISRVIGSQRAYQQYWARLVSVINSSVLPIQGKQQQCFQSWLSAGQLLLVGIWRKCYHTKDMKFRQARVMASFNNKKSYFLFCKLSLKQCCTRLVSSLSTVKSQC